MITLLGISEVTALWAFCRLLFAVGSKAVQSSYAIPFTSTWQAIRKCAAITEIMLKRSHCSCNWNTILNYDKPAIYEHIKIAKSHILLWDPIKYIPDKKRNNCLILLPHLHVQSEYKYLQCIRKALCHGEQKNTRGVSQDMTIEWLTILYI